MICHILEFILLFDISFSSRCQNKGHHINQHFKFPDYQRQYRNWSYIVSYLRITKHEKSLHNKIFSKFWNKHNPYESKKFQNLDSRLRIYTRLKGISKETLNVYEFKIPEV